MTNMDYKFFSKEKVDEQFQEIIEKCTDEHDPNTLMQILSRILINRTITARPYQDDEGSLTLWRVTRVYDGFNSENKEKYQYPPKELCKQLRANIKGYPVLYTASDPMTAIAEMKGTIELGEKFFLSKWNLSLRKAVNIHELLLNTNTTLSSSRLNDYVMTHKESLQGMVTNIPQKFGDGYLYSMEKLGNLFTSNYYHITSAYAHQVLYTFRNQGMIIDGILYPSVENKQNSFNFAFHPNVVDDGLIELQEVFEISIKENNIHLEDARVNVEIFKRGIFKGSEFQHWEFPYYKITEIDYSEVQIRTYSGFHFKGNDAIEKKIVNKGITIKQLIDGFLDQKEFQHKIADLQVEGKKIDVFNTEEVVYEYTMLLQLGHGNKVETVDGESCIEVLALPLTWIKKYLPENEMPEALIKEHKEPS